MLQFLTFPLTVFPNVKEDKSGSNLLGEEKDGPPNQEQENALLTSLHTTSLAGGDFGRMLTPV
jgi:hypothetical protein